MHPTIAIAAPKGYTVKISVVNKSSKQNGGKAAIALPPF